MFETHQHGTETLSDHTNATRPALDDDARNNQHMARWRAFPPMEG
jgi:hypothetical protein